MLGGRSGSRSLDSPPPVRAARAEGIQTWAEPLPAGLLVTGYLAGEAGGDSERKGTKGAHHKTSRRSVIASLCSELV